MSIKQTLTKAFFTTKRVAGKHAPTALIVSGTVGMLWAAYEFYKSKDEVNKVLDFYEEKEKNEEQFTRMNVALDVSKAVAKPTLITVTSVAAIATGAAIFNKRMTLLTMSLAAVTEEHARYRQRARMIMGEEEFAKLNMETVEVVDPETKLVDERSVAINNGDLYARWLQYSSKYEKGDVSYNEHLLKDAQQWAYERISSRGELLYADLMEYIGWDVAPYQMSYVWYDTSGFYLEWTEHEVFDEKTMTNSLEYLVTWKKPVPKYS